MKNIIMLVLLVGSMLLNKHASAGDTTSTIKNFMQKVQQAYRQAHYLSFNVLYRYANINEPGNYIDTMMGEIAMDKNRSRFVIENVETIITGKYSIRVMKEDKLIYLSTASPSPVGADPVQMLDSVLAHLKGVQMQITRSNGLATLYISFPPDQVYKNISVTINESTSYFQKVVYELYTQSLVEKDQMAESGNTGSYQREGYIEVLFSNYGQGKFDDALFNEGQYFIRQATGNYEPSGKYKDYQIFLASPNL